MGRLEAVAYLRNRISLRREREDMATLFEVKGVEPLQPFRVSIPGLGGGARRASGLK